MASELTRMRKKSKSEKKKWIGLRISPGWPGQIEKKSRFEKKSGPASESAQPG